MEDGELSDYTDRIDAARNTGGNLFRQVMAAALKAAADIAGEDPATQNHDARLAWATRLRFGGVDTAQEFARRLMPQVLENATIQASPEAALDSDVQFVVNSLVNDWIDKG